MLHELDKELQSRGHRYVRYADDSSIYVRSEQSARRVLESISEHIEKKLKLKVNKEKSKVSRPQGSMLLGFSFFRSNGSWQIRIAPTSVERIKQKMRECTQRKNPAAATEKIKTIETVVKGWVAYFRIAKAKSKMQELDEMVRSRLRMGIWKQWKQPATRIKNLLRLGLNSFHPLFLIHPSILLSGC